jgi:alcohol dehydrogenase
MKCAYITHYGGPDALQIGTQGKPEIGPREILIQVKAASINPVDYKIRQGMLKQMLDYRLPLILGQDLSGVVARVGEKVSRFKVGDEVFARLEKSRIGTWAELAAVRESDAALKPKNLSHVEAASLPLVALTSWQIIHDIAGVKAGQRVLIHAGSGGVGTVAIQLAKHAGATVYTTCSPRNVPLVKRLGADVVIDYKTQRFEDIAKDIDFVFDTQGGEIQHRSFTVLKDGGTLISIGGIPTRRVMEEWNRPIWIKWFASFANRKSTALAKARGIKFDYHFMSPSGAQLGAIAKLCESKTLVPLVDKVFSLDDAVKAVAYAEEGHAVGKVVIEVSP